jgi:DNA polymerase-4
LQLELPLTTAGRLPPRGNRSGSEVESSRWGVDRSIDAIREKFGRTAVGYATAVFSGADRVPEEFRELAERAPGESQEWE